MSSATGSCTSVNDPGSTSPDHEYVCQSSPDAYAQYFYFYLSDQSDTIEFNSGGTSGNIVWAGAGDDQITLTNLGPYPTIREGFVHGEDGHDTIVGGPSLDWLYGGPGDDELDAKANRDVVYGDDGADLIRPGAGPDKIYGGIGIDQLAGGDGADSLAGGADDDRLFGGTGYDALDGQGGVDCCRVSKDGGSKVHC